MVTQLKTEDIEGYNVRFYKQGNNYMIVSSKGVFQIKARNKEDVIAYVKKNFEKQELSFDELSKEAKEKAIEDHREINVDYDWYEGIEFKALEEAKKYFILKDKGQPFEFSGFWSQGDGARILIEGIKDDVIPQKLKDYDYSVRQEFYGNYQHENSFNLQYDLYGNYPEAVDKQAEKFTDEMQEKLRNLSGKLYRELEEIYNDYTSDESIADTLRVNEYKFNKLGKMI